jgi:hypothetical protein
MPAALRYLTEPNTPEMNALEQSYQAEWTARKKAHAAAWKYVDGDHHRHLLPDNSQTDDNVIINLAELIINKGVSALMGTSEAGVLQGVRFEVVDQPGEPGYMRRAVRAVRQAVQGQTLTAQQQLIDATWNANQKDALLHDLALFGGVCGHCFVKLLPDGVTDFDSGATVARLVALNPDICTVFWSAGDKSHVLWYRTEYSVGPESRREDVVRGVDENGQPVDGWLIYTYIRRTNGAQWEAQGKPLVWEYDFPPICDWPNLPDPRGYYGKNDLGIVGALNDSLNFTASNTQRIIKFHAHPKTVAIGITADQITPTDVDGIWAISAPKDEVEVKNLEMQSDLSSSMNYMQTLRRAIFDMARELDPATVDDRLGQLTNFGLRVLNGDHINKAGTKRLLYGNGLTNLNRRIMMLASVPVLPINNNWPDILPTDDLGQANALDVDTRHGLSNETYLERRRYDPALEEERRQIQRGEQAEDQAVAQQGNMSNTLEILGRLRGRNGG